MQPSIVFRHAVARRLGLYNTRFTLWHLHFPVFLDTTSASQERRKWSHCPLTCPNSLWNPLPMPLAKRGVHPKLTCPSLGPWELSAYSTSCQLGAAVRCRRINLLLLSYSPLLSSCPSPKIMSISSLGTWSLFTSCVSAKLCLLQSVLLPLPCIITSHLKVVWGLERWLSG